MRSFISYASHILSQIKNQPTLSESCKVLGKYCRVIVENTSDNGKTALKIAMDELLRIEEKFCKYKNNSLIAKINRRAGLNHPTPVDEETRSLIRFIDAMHKKSKGNFDPTLSSLSSDFDQSESERYYDVPLNKNLSLVGWQNLIIDDVGAKLNLTGASVELNSCIVAYALDSIRRKLVSIGTGHAFIEIDGNATAIGKQSDGSNWLVGLRHSVGAGGAINRVKLDGQSLVVSGQIENTVVLGKERFSGAIDPHSGNLIPGMLVCAVQAPTALEAYSVSKICWVQPEQEGLSLLESLELPFFVINRNLNCYGKLSAI